MHWMKSAGRDELTEDSIELDFRLPWQSASLSSSSLLMGDIDSFSLEPRIKIAGFFHKYSNKILVFTNKGILFLLSRIQYLKSWIKF